MFFLSVEEVLTFWCSAFSNGYATGIEFTQCHVSGCG